MLFQLNIYRTNVLGCEKMQPNLIRGTSDANIPFDDLRGMLTRLGFDERIRGSHHVYRKEGIEEKLNITAGWH